MEERAGRGGDDLTSHSRLGHVFPKGLAYYNPPHPCNRDATLET